MMEVHIYWQSIVLELILYLLVYALVVYLVPKKDLFKWIKWLTVLCIISIIVGVFTGKFMQKTDLPEQEELVKRMKVDVNSNKNILNDYLKGQPDREKEKTQAEHDAELKLQQTKNRDLILQIEGERL